MRTPDPNLVAIVRDAARPLPGDDAEFDELLAAIGDARFVLLGEASHGTHEFYRVRAQITERLIREKGFDAVAVEADWPDAYRVNRFVRGSPDASATEALGDFRRFPAWMWRNTDVVHFVEWLRARNDALAHGERKAGFYGLDLYSLHTSMEAVVRVLERVDPDAARRARERYSCFDHFGDDAQNYGFLTGLAGAQSCEREVMDQLLEIQRRGIDFIQRAGLPEDEAFFVEQNARLVRNAEEYYRSMFMRNVSTWNLRDQHMMETLEALAAHLSRDGHEARIVVWAHNSHLGDARATEMGGRRGELNLGQLVRERYGKRALLVGFTTDHGYVTAASEWGAPAERKRVRPGLPGSYEALFHATRMKSFLLRMRRSRTIPEAVAAPHLERAIGVIYLPETERASHYFRAELPRQFDAVLHFDETRAVEPLEPTSQWERGELPETYPTGV
jgi:erythromycin esterase-like protein